MDPVRSRIKIDQLLAASANDESEASPDIDLNSNDTEVEVPESPPLSFRKFLTMQVSKNFI